MRAACYAAAAVLCALQGVAAFHFGAHSVQRLPVDHAIRRRSDDISHGSSSKTRLLGHPVWAAGAAALAGLVIAASDVNADATIALDASVSVPSPATSHDFSLGDVCVTPRHRASQLTQYLPSPCTEVCSTCSSECPNPTHIADQPLQNTAKCCPLYICLS